MVAPYYPNQVPWVDKENWVSEEQPGDLVEADHVNQLYAEVNAIGQDVVTHKSDYANPHRVKAEQVFSIGGIPSGTAFPTTPANYTLFYRADLKKLFIYLP